MDSKFVTFGGHRWLFAMAMWGTIGFGVTVVEYLQEWLRAHRNINKEVPALAASVEELRKGQSRLEAELEQIRRAGIRDARLVEVPRHDFDPDGHICKRKLRDARRSKQPRRFGLAIRTSRPLPGARLVAS